MTFTIIDEAEDDDLESLGIETSIDLETNHCTVLLTSEAVLCNREILLGYVPEQILKNAFSILCQEERITDGINRMAGAFRQAKTIDLIKGFLKMTVQDRKKYKEMCYYYLVELFCRSHFWKITKRIRETAEDTYKKVKLKNMINKLMKQAES